jgi:hypothetical protein
MCTFLACVYVITQPPQFSTFCTIFTPASYPEPRTPQVPHDTGAVSDTAKPVAMHDGPVRLCSRCCDDLVWLVTLTPIAWWTVAVSTALCQQNLFVFRIIFKINNHYFPTRHNQLIFRMEARCVLCKVRTECLHTALGLFLACLWAF